MIFTTCPSRAVISEPHLVEHSQQMLAMTRSDTVRPPFASRRTSYFRPVSFSSRGGVITEIGAARRGCSAVARQSGATARAAISSLRRGSVPRRTIWTVVMHGTWSPKNSFHTAFTASWSFSRSVKKRVA